MLTLGGIEKRFDDQQVLVDITLKIEEGEVVVLLGPSGCGKTTLLRIIAGLEEPDRGRLSLDNDNLAQIPVHQRGFGMVFQDYALFPHKNVFENVSFGLRMLAWDQAAIAERVAQVLGLVDLGGLENRTIFEISGGEKQRVALARSLAPSPRLLLLDEPLGALDKALRERLMLDLRGILKKAGSVVGRPGGITAVYVTHDQSEAFAIADRVIVMNEGRIEQDGRPVDLYKNPATPFVARFLGMDNLVEGEVMTGDPLLVKTKAGNLSAIQSPEIRLAAGNRIVLLIRPTGGRLLQEDETCDSRNNVLDGRLKAISFRGRYTIATISVPDYGPHLKFELDTTEHLPQINSKIRIAISPHNIQPLTRG